MSYTFPSDASGDYVITAYVYDGDGTTTYQMSYTVSVSGSSTGTTEDTSTQDTSTEDTGSTETTTTTPSSPTDFSLAHGYATGIVGLYWSNAESNGGATITDYEYQYRSRTGYGSNVSDWSDWSSWSSAGTSGFSLVYSLTSRAEYEFKMRAVNSEGGGSETSTASIRVK